MLKFFFSKGYVRCRYLNRKSPDVDVQGFLVLCIYYSGLGKTTMPRDCAGLTRVFDDFGLDRFLGVEAKNSGRDGGEEELGGVFLTVS
jgi:hypothetical protein